jgi:septal ring factor EnvC (AmiA/AmiB activator)
MYNESRILVVSGKTPITQSAKSDSLHRNKGFVAPSTADSMLRHKIENDSQYRLNKAKNNSLIENTLNAVAPMYGIISDRFNSNSLRGVRINGTKDAQVQAVADGVVVASEWSPSAAHSIVVQHKDNYLSIYRNLSQVLVVKGQAVKSRQVLGYNAMPEVGDKTNPLFELEIWNEGKPVDPEIYIVF